jgi:hypothetical protein
MGNPQQDTARYSGAQLLNAQYELNVNTSAGGEAPESRSYGRLRRTNHCAHRNVLATWLDAQRLDSNPELALKAPIRPRIPFPETTMDQSSISGEMQQCLDNCLACHRLCTETAAHVLHGGHPHSEAKHLVALLDCAQICMVHADFMLRRSPHHTHLSKECAEICSACATLCEEHADPDGKMAACAKACRACAESCSKM